jgi:NAD(P)-dependent dehydrogenase (short-subunit alcohol dehydrogenase family)
VQAAFLPCDVTKETDLAAAAQWLETNWGGVDVVINNAGVAAAGGIADYELPDWEWILDINLLGVVRGCKVFTPLFRRQGGGRFINIASMAGLMNLPKMAPYNASKAAVISLSETLAYELAADNIKVSVVCPSFF